MNNGIISSTYSMLRKYVSSSVLLILATIVALVVANSSAGHLYRNLWEQPVSFSIGNFNAFCLNGHAMSLGQFINDFLMAIFFLSVGLEIKREILYGELSNVKKALAPVIGACGGMLIPVVVFYLVCPKDPAMERGMAIPMATDIAFSLGCLSIFSKRCPAGLKAFLATLAVADDLGGIVVIAIRYTEHLNLLYLFISAFVVVLLCISNWKGIRPKTFYLFMGFLLWYFMLGSGIHATIAGVILAFCVPASISKDSGYYIERIRQELKSFLETKAVHEDSHRPARYSAGEMAELKSIESSGGHLVSPLQDMEEMLKVLVNYFIIPLFAFANAGVNLAGMNPSDIFSGVGLAVFLGLLVGKFCGVLSFSWLGVKLGITQLPTGANWKSFASLCMLCGIGFTVSMFMATLSYPGAIHADLLNNAKLGILCGSTASALAGCLLLNKFLPKKIS